MKEMVGQVSIFDQDIWCGKMSPEPSAVTKEKTSESSLKKSQKSATKMPLFLCLQKANGQTADASWETDGVSLGGYSMHSFGESPKEGVESHLSQILEVNPHPRYCLSAKACQGILTRASRRGKELPPMLKEALEQRIELERNNVPATMEEKIRLLKTCYEIGKESTAEPGAAKRLGGYVWEGLAPTLRTEVGDNRPSVAYGISSYNSNAMKSRNPPVYSVENHPNDSRVGINEDGIVQALTSRMGTGGGNVPMVMQCYSKSKRAQSSTDDETWVESGTANTLNAFDVGDVRTTEAVVYALDRASYNQGKNAQYDFEISDKGINSPLVAKGPGAVCYGINGDKAGTLDASYYKGCGMRSGLERDVVAIPIKTRYIVRRLTPLECERLQGYPDGWTDIGEWTDSNGKKRQTSDATRYKALVNSISLPNWKWLLKRLCACYERDATMASLFDGIGGFPYLWEQLNGKGTCLWASEIEEFPMAVTKVRIGE